MWIIVVPIVFFSITALSNKKYRYIASAGFLLFILMYSFRGYVGSDVTSYEYYYNHVNDPSINRLAGFEYGYFLVSKLFYNMGLPYMALQSAISIFISLVFLYAISSYTKNFGIAFLVGLWFFFYPSLEIARQIISLSLFFLSLKYLENDWKKYWFFNIIGLFFHRTAVMALLFYFFCKHKVFKYTIIVGMIGVTFLEPFIIKVLSFTPMLLEKYQWYFVYSNQRGINSSHILSLKLIEHIVWLIGMGILDKRQKKIEKQGRKTALHSIKGINFERKVSPYEAVVKNLISLGFCIQVFVGTVTNYAYRLMYYTDIGFILGCCFLYDRMEEKKYKVVYVLGLILYIVFRFYRIVSANLTLFI